MSLFHSNSSIPQSNWDLVFGKKKVEEKETEKKEKPKKVNEKDN
jgi:hypothetical protein